MDFYDLFEIASAFAMFGVGLAIFAFAFFIVAMAIKEIRGE
jgi:hypothetical protein